MALVPSYIERLQPYQPGLSIDEVRREYGLSRIVKLASNENPLGSSPAVAHALASAISNVHLYPNCGLDLRRALARKFRTEVENVTVGSGSDAIIGDIVRTFLSDQDEVLTTEAAFSSFQVLAKSRGVPYRTVPYKNWAYDLDAMAAAINDNTKLIYLANPNNPTGTYFTADTFERFYRHVPSRVLILLDEAYFEYAQAQPGYPDSMHYRYDNVITLRTFSKAYGLAGLRVGYGLAHEELIGNLLKLRLTFEPNILGEFAALAALDDNEFLRTTVELNGTERTTLTLELQKRGFTVVPSAANFVMVPFAAEQHASAFAAELLKRGVIVRYLRSFGLPHCVRISIGSSEQNRFFLDQLDAVMAKSIQFEPALSA